MNVARLGPSTLAAHAALRAEIWPEAAAKHADELRALFDRPTFAAFGAFDADALIGFAESTIREYVDGTDAQPAGYLEGIYVAPAHRRVGVAAALTGAVMTWAREHGCAELGSDALIEDVESHAWHARAGFEEIERVTRFARPIVGSNA